MQCTVPPRASPHANPSPAAKASRGTLPGRGVGRNTLGAVCCVVFGNRSPQTWVLDGGAPATSTHRRWQASSGSKAAAHTGLAASMALGETKSTNDRGVKLLQVQQCYAHHCVVCLPGVLTGLQDAPCGGGAAALRQG